MGAKNILMVASENDALPKAKVGGIGDVLRDLPPALAHLGHTAQVIIPSYGYLHKLPGTELAARFPVAFGGRVETVALFQIHQKPSSGSAVRIWTLEHPSFYPGGVGRIYCDDGHNKPFASDATKYALFCAAVGQSILNGVFGDLDIIHLHDWHAATLAVLRAFDPHYRALQSIWTVYTIHNLALQGTRPLGGDASSLQTWFPKLLFDHTEICDPKLLHCYNPMRAAIRLCDKIHAVSPTYAKEILRPSDHAEFVYGGEGLETDIQSADQRHKLVGILNGCEYPEKTSYAKLSKSAFLTLLQDSLVHWVSNHAVMPSAHWIAIQRLAQWQRQKQSNAEPAMLVTSVGRLTEQKARLLEVAVTVDGVHASVMEHLLKILGNRGRFLMLGSGAVELEAFFLSLSGRFNNFIFLNGYSDAVSQAIYRSGDLFLMPSSFEPCGISQMLAMRAGQPCLAHAVGGLNDTIENGLTGFMFDGHSGEVQAHALLDTFQKALNLFCEDPKAYDKVRKKAAEQRFSWEDASKSYLDLLYSK